ncbi:hypothetical protein ACH3XW_45905 [Acanthocheilonema viteae]
MIDRSCKSGFVILTESRQSRNEVLVLKEAVLENEGMEKRGEREEAGKEIVGVEGKGKRMPDISSTSYNNGKQCGGSD